MGGGSAPTNSTYTNVGKYSALDSLYFLLFTLTVGALFLLLRRKGYAFLPYAAAPLSQPH